MLGKLISTSQRDWDRHLTFIMFTFVMLIYRNIEHEGTGFTPCRLFLGREVVLLIDLVLIDCKLHNPVVLSYADYVEQTGNRMGMSLQVRDSFLSGECSFDVCSKEVPAVPIIWLFFRRGGPSLHSRRRFLG